MPRGCKTILANATRQRETTIELEVARRRLRETGVLGALVGSSRPMREIFGLIEQIAPSNVSVLITGESGTGKELVARTLHDLSPRKVAALCRGQLRGDSRDADRERNLRPRKGRIHRRGGAARRLLRAGQRRHAAAGRDRRDAGWPRRPSCCACWKSASCAGWARAPSRMWTCACSRPPIAIPNRPWRRAICAPTSFTGSMSSTSTCRRCAITWKICPPWRRR